jgi:hypothetical protein
MLPAALAGAFAGALAARLAGALAVALAAGLTGCTTSFHLVPLQPRAQGDPGCGVISEDVLRYGQRRRER